MLAQACCSPLVHVIGFLVQRQPCAVRSCHINLGVRFRTAASRCSSLAAATSSRPTSATRVCATTTSCTLTPRPRWSCAVRPVLLVSLLPKRVGCTCRSITGPRRLRQARVASRWNASGMVHPWCVTCEKQSCLACRCPQLTTLTPARCRRAWSLCPSTSWQHMWTRRCAGWGH